MCVCVHERVAVSFISLDLDNYVSVSLSPLFVYPNLHQTHNFQTVPATITYPYLHATVCELVTRLLNHQFSWIKKKLVPALPTAVLPAIPTATFQLYTDSLSVMDIL